MGKLRDGKITTTFDGKKLWRNLPNNSKMPDILMDKLTREVTTPSVKNMGWRAKFALAICKKIRFYVTKGKEEALLCNTGKCALVR